MRAADFHKLLDQVSALSMDQRKKLAAAIEECSAKDGAIAAIAERAVERPPCPACGAEKPHRWGTMDEVQRFRCAACGKTYNALTGTPLARLRNKDRWVAYGEAMISGLSVRRAAEKCRIHPATAFRWRHRFLQLPERVRDLQLSGIVEADETYFLESFKGSRAWVKAKLAGTLPGQIPRKPRKRGGAALKRGLSREQIPVLVARDRNGHHFDMVIPLANAKTIDLVLPQLLGDETVLCTDGASAYRVIAKKRGLEHRALNQKAGQHSQERIFHIQNVNAYDSRLKEWMRRFKGVATFYLPNYLGWRRLLERHGRGLTPHIVLRCAIDPKINS